MISMSIWKRKIRESGAPEVNKKEADFVLFLGVILGRPTDLIKKAVVETLEKGKYTGMSILGA